MKIVTARQMQQIDNMAIDKFGIPALILMENAARVAASCALRMLKLGQTNVFFFCGQGNNGADGFACARHLVNRGLKIKVCFVGREEKLSPEAKINYLILRKLGQKILKPNLSLLKKEINSADLIIDALLGIGLKSEVKEPYFSLIKLINSSHKTVLSLDIPSGLDATSGKVCGIAVKADRTITFGLVKRAFLNLEAKKYLGKVIVGDISLPRRLLY